MNTRISKREIKRYIKFCKDKLKELEEERNKM